MTDATTGPSAADRAAIKLLRESGKPVLFAANKADSPAVDADAFDLYRLGVDKVYPVSALHGRGIGELEADLVAALPEPVPGEPDDERGPPRIALVGRPNAGKSSLLNRILGEDRMLVDSRPGTTRDSIDALVDPRRQEVRASSTPPASAESRRCCGKRARSSRSACFPASRASSARTWS